MHNCLYINKRLLGYTCLRKRTFIINSKKIKYLLFDSLIIKKEMRKKKLSINLMNFNNKVIKKNKKLSFLICNKNLVSFYKKFSWKKIPKNKFKIIDHKFSSNCMYCNSQNKLKYPINIYFSK